MRLRLLLAMLAVQVPLAAAAQEPQEPLERCLYFSGTSNSIRKARAVEESLEGLREVIDKWKLENGIFGPVTETPQRPEPNRIGGKRFGGPFPDAGYRLRHRLQALLEGRGVAGGLHFRKQGLLVRPALIGARSNRAARSVPRSSS